MVKLQDVDYFDLKLWALLYGLLLGGGYWLSVWTGIPEWAAMVLVTGIAAAVLYLWWRRRRRQRLAQPTIYAADVRDQGGEH